MKHLATEELSQEQIFIIKLGINNVGYSDIITEFQKNSKNIFMIVKYQPVYKEQQLVIVGLLETMEEMIHICASMI